MNICIGGPWHRCKLLGDTRKKSFTLRDEKIPVSIKYNKRTIKIKGQVYVFWILDGLSESVVSSYLHDYLRDYFMKADIELNGDE